MDKNRFISDEEIGFLKEIAGKIIEKCRREAIAMVNGTEQRVNVYVPGGDDKYPSFWIRDAIMQCSSGMIPVEEMTTMLDIIMLYQNADKTRHLEYGLRILPWSFADHINLKGLGDKELGAVFFPGTYSPGNNQGLGRHGTVNAGDNSYEVIQLVHLICNAVDEPVEFLNTRINGIKRIERLNLSFDAVLMDNHTQLHRNSKDSWTADSFHDALKKEGFILLTSCMRFRAAKQMEHFHTCLNNNTKSSYYRDIACRLSRSVSQTFVLDDGWLMAATELNRQADVWGTSLAIYEGVLNQETEKRAIEALLKSYREDTIAFKGYLRHIPTNYDTKPGQQAWEDGYGSYGIYQYGGYWPQPTGWYAYALSKADMPAAENLAREFIVHTKEFLEQGAPFEWISPSLTLEDTPRLGRWYGPSISLPLAAFKRMQTEISIDKEQI